MAKILLIEDDPNLMMCTQEILQTAGYLVMTASTGQMALDWLANSKPDLVLLDVGLPDMSGIEVCKKIKSDSSTRRIPVIVLTAFKDNQTKMQANLNAHADLFLNKPVENKELLDAIKIILEKTSSDNALRRNLFRRNRPL
ncbi:MAG: response regulator transcription factor [Elusimicrobiales bacterium]|nr:response regulator transcription factor [Elusimicrobiales bacterium]